MKRRLFKGRVETSTDKSLGEDASKQGRNGDQTEDLNLTNRVDTEVIVEDIGSGKEGGSTADQVSTAKPEFKKRYPLIKKMLEKMLNWKLEAEAKSTMAFELLNFIKSLIK
nr:hypothetical protein [Tanacetum cinerariifolium]